MSDFDSLTKVSKQELQRAITNFIIRKEQDKVKYKQVLADWKKSYKLSWWERNIGKLDNLTDEEFAVATFGLIGNSLLPSDFWKKRQTLLLVSTVRNGKIL